MVEVNAGQSPEEPVLRETPMATRTQAKKPIPFESQPAGMSKDEQIKAYRLMLLIRRFEEKAGQLYGQQKIRGFCHLYIGQEACASGAITALEKEDKWITAYRCHAHPLGLGTDPGAVMAADRAQLGDREPLPVPARRASWHSGLPPSGLLFEDRFFRACRRSGRARALPLPARAAPETIGSYERNADRDTEVLTRHAGGPKAGRRSHLSTMSTLCYLRMVAERHYTHRRGEAMSTLEFHGIYRHAIEIRRALGERWRQEVVLSQLHPLIRLPDGQSYERIRYGYETRRWRRPSRSRCGDCGVSHGSFHWRGCDQELCPRCRNQLISCEWWGCAIGIEGMSAPTVTCTPSIGGSSRMRQS
jgi:hypothetical protein